MKWRKNIFNTCIFLIVCTIAGLIIAYNIAKPIKLTDSEINYYTEVAEKVWFEGLSEVEADDNIVIKFQLKEKKVKIFPIDSAKESITVNFSNYIREVTVNDPIVSFWGCFVFYGFVFGTILYFVICFVIFIVKKSRR